MTRRSMMQSVPRISLSRIIILFLASSNGWALIAAPFESALNGKVLVGSVQQAEVDQEANVDEMRGEAQTKTGKLSLLPDPEGAKRLSPTDRIWVDPVRKIVVVDGHVSLRKGYLEMFACPAGTKEHESIVAVDAQAYLVHTGLLAIGAVPGHPVKYQPAFIPATGAKIEIKVRWRDQQGTWHSASASEWMSLPNRTSHGVEEGKSPSGLGGKAKGNKADRLLPRWWVFAGSGFWKDEATGKRHYMAEGGDLICVSNFSTATLDLPVESSQTNDDLLFVAKTENIPPVGTPVRLILRELRVENRESKKK